jgi:acid phosphatase (class A)
MVNGGPTCAPEDEDGLRKNGSYPSGHTAIGWAWALTLAEVAPDRADAVCARARLCRKPAGVQRALAERRPRRPLHGAGTVARLHEQAQFRDDVAAARQEVVRAACAA